MKKLSIAWLILIVLGLSAFFIQRNKTPAIERIERIACQDIVQTCANDLLSVRFNEAPQVMQPLHLVVNVRDDQTVQEIHANFAMKGMEMGFNRYQLIQAAEREWQAEVTLPVCMQGRSDWEMLLEIKATRGNRRILVPFSAAQK